SAACLARLRVGDGGPDRVARVRFAARQRLCRGRGLSRPGRRPCGSAHRPSPDRTRRLAGPRPPLPPGFHHPQSEPRTSRPPVLRNVRRPVDDRSAFLKKPSVNLTGGLVRTVRPEQDAVYAFASVFTVREPAWRFGGHSMTRWLTTIAGLVCA